MAIDSITPYSQWPYWLQFVVVAPNALLSGITCWIWWPRTDRGWRRFGFVAAYLLVFFLIMHFIFKF